jgi:hypothetical protein
LLPARYIESSGTRIASTSAQITTTMFAMKNAKKPANMISITPPRRSSPGERPIGLPPVA